MNVVFDPGKKSRKITVLVRGRMEERVPCMPVVKKFKVFGGCAVCCYTLNTQS